MIDIGVNVEAAKYRSSRIVGRFLETYETAMTVVAHLTTFPLRGLAEMPTAFHGENL